MAFYRKSPEAERDLIQIWKHIASDDFLIFYRESQGGIEVIRVLSGRRDLRSIFDAE